MSDKQRFLKILFTLLVASLIISPVLAETTTINLPTSSSVETTNIILQENVKTRLEIKQYCDNKIDYMVSLVKTEGADIVGQNFRELDRRIQETSTKLFIKAVIGVFCAILLSQLVFYIIKRKVERKHLLRATSFKERTINPEKAGYVQLKQKTDDLEVPKPPIIKEELKGELPSFPEVQPRIMSWQEKEWIEKQKNKELAKRREEAKKKLNELIKIHNKNREHNKKLEKKLSKPSEEKQKLDEEHERIQKQIDKIKEENNFQMGA